MMTNIFVDLDGVLADFNKKVIEIFGQYPTQFKKQEWNKISNYPNFYGSLELLPNALKLWENLVQLKKQYNYKLYILTGLPMGDWAEPQKRDWCKKYLYDYDLVITCFSRNKHYYSTSSDILIDDNINNCRDWKGYSIQYNDLMVDKAIEQLINKISQ